MENKEAYIKGFNAAFDMTEGFSENSGLVQTMAGICEKNPNDPYSRGFTQGYLEGLRQRKMVNRENEINTLLKGKSKSDRGRDR